MLGLEFRVMALAPLPARAERPCADGATPLPGICGWRRVLLPANLVEKFQKSIEIELSINSSPAVKQPKLFQVGV